MENIYKAQITVNGSLEGVPHSWMNFWDYPGIGGKKITLPYIFECIIKADSPEEAEKKYMQNRALKRVYKTHYFSYSVNGVSEVEEGIELPLEERVKMLRKGHLVLEE